MKDTTVAACVHALASLSRLQRHMFLAGLLDAERALHLAIAKEALHAALGFLPDLHAITEALENEILSDTALLRRLDRHDVNASKRN